MGCPTFTDRNDHPELDYGPQLRAFKGKTVKELRQLLARAMLSSQQKDLKIRLLKVEVQRLDLAYRALGGQNVGDTLRESLTERIRPLFKRRRGAPVRNDSPSGIMKSLRERFGIDIIDSFELLRCEAAASLGIEKASDKEALRFFVRRHYFDGVMNLSST